MNKYLDLFLTFSKIGAFTFGGGYAMIPLIEQEVVEKKQWIKAEDVIDIIAISESTPGVLAVNCATYIGYKIGGFFGSLLATLGVVLPSFFIILAISIFLNAFQENQYIQNFLIGVKAGVVVLLFKAVVKLGKACKNDKFGYILAALGFVVAVLFDIPVILMLLTGALIGIIYGIIKKTKNKEVGDNHA